MKSDDLRSILDTYVEIADEARAEDGSHYSTPGMRRLVEVLSSTGFLPNFNWIEWSKSIGRETLRDPASLETAGLETLRRLMTAHLRINRFTEGHLRAIFRNGYMDAYFERLKALIPEEATPSG